MLVMFSVGVASLLAMAALTALMVHEKTQSGGRRVVPVAGATLFATALMIAVYSA
jgi:predicted metal-binding membrane protein